MKHATPSNATEQAKPAPELSLPEYIREYEPVVILDDNVTEHLADRAVWLDATERNLGVAPTFRADGVRVYALPFLLWSHALAGHDDVGGLEMPGGARPDGLAERLEWAINATEVEMERDAASGATSPERTAARLAAIHDADARLIEMGVYRPATLGWGPRRPAAV